MMSWIYWGVLLSIILLGGLAETHPVVFRERNGSIRLRPDRVLSLILSLFLILVSGLRYWVGTDFRAYYYWNVGEWQEVWHSLISFREGGFAFLVRMARTIWADGQSVIFFSSLVTVGLYTWTIYRDSRSYLLSMLLYLFLGQWQSSFNGIRQCLAAAILFAGHKLILERKYAAYFFVVLLASTFHVTAVVMIIPVYLFHRQADVRQLLFLATGAVILRFSYDFIFQVLGTLKGKAMERYGTEYSSQGVNVFRVLVSFVPVIIYYVFCEKETATKAQTFYINSILFNAFCMLAGMGSAYFARFAMYTNAMVTIAYGYLFSMIRDGRVKRVIFVAVLFMYTLYWLYSIRAGGISAYQWALGN